MNDFKRIDLTNLRQRIGEHQTAGTADIEVYANLTTLDDAELSVEAAKATGAVVVDILTDPDTAAEEMRAEAVRSPVNTKYYAKQQPDGSTQWVPVTSRQSPEHFADVTRRAVESGKVLVRLTIDPSHPDGRQPYFDALNAAREAAARNTAGE